MAKTRRTYQPHKTPRISKLGFMAKMSTVGGRKVLKSRRAKGRAEMTASDEVRRDKTKRFSRIK